MSSYPKPIDYVAVILAGGAAERFGGTVPVGLKTLLPHARYASILHYLLDFLAHQKPRPLVHGLNIHPEQHGALQQWLSEQHPAQELLAMQQALIFDQVADNASHQRQGPMSGIVAALQWTQQHYPQARWLLTLSGDSVNLPQDLASRLFAAAENIALQWIVAANASRLQPPISLWRMDIVDQVFAMYAAGERKIDRIACQFPHTQVCWPHCTFDNVNDTNQHAALCHQRL